MQENNDTPVEHKNDTKNVIAEHRVQEQGGCYGGGFVSIAWGGLGEAVERFFYLWECCIKLNVDLDI